MKASAGEDAEFIFENCCECVRIERVVGEREDSYARCGILRPQDCERGD